MKSTLDDFKVGFSSFFDGWKFIREHRLYYFFLFPIALNLILFFTGFELADYIQGAISAQLHPYLESFKSKFSEMSFLSTIVEFSFSILIRVFVFIVYAFFGGYFILILLSPVLAYLSEKTEEIQKNIHYPFDLIQFLKDVLRGIILSLRNFIIELLLTVLFFFCGFIPVVGIVFPFLMFFVSAYFYGFSFLDYTLERRRKSVSESLRIIRKRKGLAVSVGTIFALPMFIPFLGITIAGFFAIVTTVGATLAANNLNLESEN